MSDYPINAPTLHDGPAFERALAQALEDHEGDLRGLADWITAHTPRPDEDETPTYCEDCDGRGERLRYPTNLTAEDRRRHDALAALERRLGIKVTAEWLHDAREVNPARFLTALRLAKHLHAYSLTTLETTADRLTRAAQHLTEAAPLFAELHRLHDHRKDPAK